MLGVIESFDIPVGNYTVDVQAIAAQTIEKFGAEEWKRIVLTNEIHGHLGIYSTLGAKMGVLAREIFLEKGIDDDIAVLSYAGSKPPVSCFNDGLQVSTGATMGHGLFCVSEQENKRAEADFSFGEISFKLKLRKEYEDRIRLDISEGVRLYDHSPAYWQYVRTLAIRYWSEWDRKVIFEIQSL